MFGASKFYSSGEPEMLTYERTECICMSGDWLVVTDTRFLY